ICIAVIFGENENHYVDNVIVKNFDCIRQTKPHIVKSNPKDLKPGPTNKAQPDPCIGLSMLTSRSKDASKEGVGACHWPLASRSSSWATPNAANELDRRIGGWHRAPTSLESLGSREREARDEVDEHDQRAGG
ncbi:hypothetical protein CRG98_022444, partial [Punica granatum]